MFSAFFFLSAASTLAYKDSCFFFNCKQMSWVLTLQVIFQISSVSRSAVFHFAFFAGRSFSVGTLSKKRPHDRTFFTRSCPIKYILDFLHDFFLSNYK